MPRRQEVYTGCPKNVSHYLEPLAVAVSPYGKIRLAYDSLRLASRCHRNMSPPEESAPGGKIMVL